MSRYDLDFRPETYFGRRAATSGVLAGGVPESANDQASQALGMAAAPSLPPLRSDEVEIAHVALRAAPAGRVSIRARRVGERIRYTVCDEYGTDFCVLRKSSTRPLSTREVIGLIDNAEDGGLVLGPLEVTFESERRIRGLRGTVAVSSSFYPALSDYYEERIAAWLGEKEAELNARREEPQAA